MAAGWVKSMGVPFTLRNSPVGISPSSTGVNLVALGVLRYAYRADPFAGPFVVTGLSFYSLQAMSYLLDTHDHPVSDPVWELYRAAVGRFGAVSTLIEWDDRMPEFERLEAESERARAIHEAALGADAGPRGAPCGDGALCMDNG